METGKNYLQGKGELDEEMRRGQFGGERESRREREKGGWIGKGKGESVWERKRDSGFKIRGKFSLSTCLVRVFPYARADLCALS